MLELSLTEIFLFLSTGAVAGILAGLLGIGGGLFIVPVLLFLLPFSGIHSEQIMSICIATSLATIVVTSVSSIIAHHKHQAVIWSLFWRLLPGICVGALAGAYVADSVSQLFLKNLFSISVILIAIKMLFKVQLNSFTELPGQSTLFFSGTFIGAISTMIGIGGGALSVPILNYWKTPMANAVATSAACGLPIAIAGTLGFIITGLDQANLPTYSTGFVYWPAVIGITLSSILFAPIGAKFAHKITASLLSRFFAIFLLIVGFNVLLG